MTDNITEEMIEAAAQAMRDEGFVDWDDDTVPTFHYETDAMGNRPSSRIDTWVPPEQVARAVLEAALAGRTVIKLPEPDLGPHTWYIGALAVIAERGEVGLAWGDTGDEPVAYWPAEEARRIFAAGLAACEGAEWLAGAGRSAGTKETPDG